jgi:hypothetical protein
VLFFAGGGSGNCVADQSGSGQGGGQAGGVLKKIAPTNGVHGSTPCVVGK